MKKSIAIALVTLLSVSAWAEDDKPEKPKGRPGGPGAGKGGGGGEFLKRLDKDGDKVITQEEAGPQIWERISRLDKNSDGKIEMSEMARPGGGPGGPGGGREPGEFMKRMDKNSDGNISKEEAGQMWERLSRLDKDGDSVITKEELASGARERMNPETMFASVDKDKDGKITESESPKMWERLSRADKDGDGAVSKEEFLAGAKMRAEAMKGKGKGAMMPGGKGGPRPGGGPSAIFGKYDEDKDGKLSKEEVPEEMWSKISRADENADGTVSQEELGSVYQRGAGKGKGKGSDAPAGDKKPKRPALEGDA